MSPLVRGSAQPCGARPTDARHRKTIEDLVPFSSLKLHPDLLKGIKELGFTRPTPIQERRSRRRSQGRDVLACAMTGSGKTAAFLLPILQRLIGQAARHDARPGAHADARARGPDPRGSERAGRPHAGHRRRRLRRRRDGPAGARLPQRRGRHRRHARTAARPLHAALRQAGRRSSTWCWTRRTACWTWASCPDIRRVLRHLPAKRQTLFFSATMPAPIVALTREMLQNPATINLERKSAPAVGITQAVYPVRAGAQVGAASWRCCSGATCRRRSSSPAPSTAPTGSPTTWRGKASRPSGSTATARRRSAPRPSTASRAGGTGCWWPPTSPPAASTSKQLGHVVNFDVPARARGLHPPGGPDRARRADGRRLHLRVARGGGRAARRSSGRSASACRG